MTSIEQVQLNHTLWKTTTTPHLSHNFHSQAEKSIQHPVTLSLFSGAGGLDIGFYRAGFNIVACVELDKVACQTLERNKGRYIHPDCQIINRDIGLVFPDDIAVKKVDFIIGGPPCQSFSAIGRRAGGAEGMLNERGHLFKHYCHLVDYYRPRGFLFENVRGILGSNKGEDWKQIVQEFAYSGYHLFYRILDTADYGVPQHRERLILVGVQDGYPEFKFPQPTFGSDSPNNRDYVSAFQAIADLQNSDEQLHNYNGKYGKLLQEVPPGKNYSYFTKEMGYPEPHFAWRSRFSDFLYKADPDKPVRTIVAKLGAYSGPFHWLSRKFTLAEFKRLQSFPDDYEFAGGLNAALQQLGNSVPPLFAEHLANTILQQLFFVNRNIRLIEDSDALSFDKRKATKAKSTRQQRGIDKVSSTQGNLFDMPEVPNIEEENQDDKAPSSTEVLFYYRSPREREIITELLNPKAGTVYQFLTNRVGEKCTVIVTSHNEGRISQKPLLKYTINFHHFVGNGLKCIECFLFSESEKDIPVVWDAIEDCLSGNSNYRTMMDVYGHFTEPHPIFDLTMETFTKDNTFLLRFAPKFSNFSMTSRVLPEKELQALYKENGGKEFDLATIARELRELRFDVRTHETNPTIPSGYFRCCYPFTININKQVSVPWRERSTILMKKSEYTEWLSKAFDEAKNLVANPDVLEQYKKQPALSHHLMTMLNGNEVPLHQTVAQGIKTLVGNLRQSKYLFSMLITGLVEKLVHQGQDIRYTQAAGGYSNRSTDQVYVTPFLKVHGLTSCAASGAESGRNFERPYPHMLDYTGKARGKGSKEAYLGIVHAVQVEGIDPFPCVVFLMASDMLNKQSANYDYPQPHGLTIQEVIDAVLRHHREAKGNGQARLPVLAIQAIYQCLVAELSRYRDTVLRNPPNRHTANDKEGWIGDIQVDRQDGTPFEGVEVKADKEITSDMVRALLEKFRGNAVDRYYILSNREIYISETNIHDINETVTEVRQQTGCQVIVNGLNKSLWYYLRMIENPDVFLRYYTEQVQSDLDTKDEHRELWSSILDELTMMRETKEN